MGKYERCGTDVTKKNLRQWMLRITKYADRLFERSRQTGLAGKSKEKCRLTGSENLTVQK